MAKKQKNGKANGEVAESPKKSREFVFWEVKGNVIEGSTSFNNKTVQIRGKAYQEALKAGKDLKKLRGVMKEANVLSSLECNRKAQKEHKCVNTHYESIRTLQVKILKKDKSASNGKK